MKPQDKQTVTVAFISGHQISTCRSTYDGGWWIPEDGKHGGTPVLAWQEDNGRWNLWPERPETVEAIRAEITRLEGELSRLSGKPIRIWDGEHGYHMAIPTGGALLDIETGSNRDAVQWWYPTLEAAKAALFLYAREQGAQGGVSENGLHAEIDFPHVAYITRRG